MSIEKGQTEPIGEEKNSGIGGFISGAIHIFRSRVFGSTSAIKPQADTPAEEGLIPEDAAVQLIMSTLSGAQKKGITEDGARSLLVLVTGKRDEAEQRGETLEGQSINDLVREAANTLLSDTDKKKLEQRKGIVDITASTTDMKVEDALAQKPAPESASPRFGKSGTIINKEERIGRNEQCPCGSGKKFKNCCMHKPTKGEKEENA